MGLAGVTTGLVLSSGAGLEAGILAGPRGRRVVWLGEWRAHRLSAALSVLWSHSGCCRWHVPWHLWFSNNRMFHELGPDEDRYLALGGGATAGSRQSGLVFGPRCCRHHSAASLHPLGGVISMPSGGSEEAAIRTGVPVARVKLLAYLMSSLTAGFSAVLMVGWLGAVTNALGQGYELRVIAASVLGGANLMGGRGWCPWCGAGGCP